MGSNFLWRNGFSKVFNEVKKLFSFKAVNNVEYRSDFYFGGNPIYYQWVDYTKRISTSPSGLIGDVGKLLHYNLTFQGISNGNPTGVKYILPYIHTNGTGIILQLNGSSLQVQSQNSNFVGNYSITGLLVYTKGS